MSLHRASTKWSRTTQDFVYDTYGRDHDWTFGGGASLRCSAAPEYRGNEGLPNPEEALVGALSSCHMLTFLAICARKGIVVDHYSDRAEGHLETGADGRLAVTRVSLRPTVVFAAGSAPDEPTLRRLHDSAHRGCFIANSVKTEVRVELDPPPVI
jgi:organic hydroperoxide reductase OsmC/OhrA